MPEDTTPNFLELARFSIEMFHPEVLDFPEDIVELAIEHKAELLRKSYQEMLIQRKQ